jgi:pimeloyl-ACP methyl ester carboxylesterase
MDTKKNLQDPMAAFDWMNAAYEYWLDAGQRWILFMDILRQRANNYFETIRKGEPPVLVFDYEVILEGRTLDRPVNYDLAKIKPRKSDVIDPEARPIIVIDPRAGNGPGIGGSKRDSEIGDALAQGHPVYFILFHPEPEPGQTLGDVEKAETRFVEEVSRRHPKAEKPTLIGNCQAGWAVALLGADRPDLTGPLVLNGSPLSYWSGVQGKNPMRYAGGLLGGIWMASFLSDLGNGRFDGAWLEENFESLNPGNTLWSKQYDLYANVDNGADRYLTFEKWWDGYSEMTKEEIHTIVENLFVGDKLEQGALSLDRKKIINLQNIEKPILLFASEGDNITPPQQALDWIIKDYGTVERIKALQKVIIYMLHPSVGHLGIFVGSKVARKEHMQIIKSVDIIEALAPGLYEMVIDDKGRKHGLSDYDVRFIERDIKDLMALNEDRETMQEEDADFSRVAAVSEINDWLYNTFASPWVRLFTTEISAQVLKQLHPLRVNKYIFSEMINPWMSIFKMLAPAVKQDRRPVSPGNPFPVFEKKVSDSIVALLDGYQNSRDHFSEALFFAIYENPWMDLLLPAASPKKKSGRQAQKEKRQEAARIRNEKQHWRSLVDEGGFEEGIIRIIMALEDSDHDVDRDELYADERILESSKRFRGLDRKEFLHMVGQQTRILQVDQDKALKALGKLIATPGDRQTARALVRKFVAADSDMTSEQEAVLSKINKALRSKSIRRPR